MLVTSLASFLGYQRESAWTWEHQALTRARAVAGKVQIRDAFEIGRREILTQPRDARKLRHDIAEMRSKMRHELDRSSDAHWDIKQGKRSEERRVGKAGVGKGRRRWSPYN